MKKSPYWESKNPLWSPASLSYINQRCAILWNDLVDNAELYGVEVITMDCGATLMDFGVHCVGSFEAGRIVAELSQGGLAKAVLGTTTVGNVPLKQITTENMQPGAGCLDMQMGIMFDNAILSGPYRLFVEPLRFVVDDIPLENAKSARIALVEPYAGAPAFSDKDALKLAQMGHTNPKDLKIMLIPGTSLTGATQVCGRAAESIVLTVHRSLLIDSSKIVTITGTSPICPHYNEIPGAPRLDNDDFIHYASDVYMVYYSEEGEDVQALASNLCYECVPYYGQYWGDLMDSVGGDFFKIPNITDVNKCGCITINDIRTGKIYSAGKKRYDLIEARLK